MAARVAVVGGGLAGLCGALELASAGHPVDVYEKYPNFGGLASAFPIRGSHLERFYHHIFATDLDILELIHDLGLQDKLVWTPENNGNWHQGRFWKISPAWKLLLFDALSVPARLKLAFWSKWLTTVKDWKPFDRVTAKDWILGHMGQEAWAVMWEPLFRAKFGAYAEQISMTWFYGRISARFGPSRPGAPRGSLGYLRGSTKVMVDELCRRLVEKGVGMHPSAGVKRIAAENGRVIGVETKEGLQAADAVLVSCATPLLRQMAQGLLPEALDRDLAQFQYYGSVVAVLELSQSVSPVYWTNVLDIGSPFLAVIEHTRMIPSSEYQGAVIVYLAKYLDTADPFFKASDAEVLKDYYAYLKKVLPAFDGSLVEKAHVMRADYTQPIVTPGYAGRIPPHRLPLKGLYLANMTQIFPEDRGMSYSIGLGKKVARMMIEDFGGTHAQS